MIYLLDTNACIGWLRLSQPNLVARIKQQVPSDLVICSVVVGELLYGVERSAPTYRIQTRQQVEKLRRMFVSLPFDDRVAEHYGVIRSHLARQGTMIGGNDLMIAAIALANRLTLVTHNTVEFSRVPGLSLEDWQ